MHAPGFAAGFTSSSDESSESSESSESAGFLAGVTLAAGLDGVAAGFAGAGAALAGAAFFTGLASTSLSEEEESEEGGGGACDAHITTLRRVERGTTVDARA